MSNPPPAAATMNQAFAITMRSEVGTSYVLGGDDATGTDCSGSVILALARMGYTVPDVTAAEMASGKVPWITLGAKADSKKQGEAGTLNFYTFGTGAVEHVNVGVGQLPGEAMPQVVDATQGAWMTARNGRPGQSVPAAPAQMNQTYSPYSSNSAPDEQAQINWAVLDAEYRTKK